VRPLDLGFELSNLCNLHCNHCIRGSHQEQIESLTLSFITRVLDEAVAGHHPLAVVLTGGEPLAAPLFPAVVAELGRRNIPYRFVTNGWHVPRHLPALLAHPPSFVRVSLSGGLAHTHDAERGHGSFRKALVAVAALLASGIRAELSLVVTRESRGEIVEAVQLANELGVGEFHVILPQPTPETAIAASDLGPEEWKAVALEVFALSRTSAVPVFIDYGAFLPFPRPLCNTLALRQVYVDGLGRVPFCCQLSRYGTGEEVLLGDLNVDSLATIVQRAEARYAEFTTETAMLHQMGARDELDEFPCLSCARRHGKTGFLADFPEHPWTQLARSA